ncbi:ABC transporter permease [Metamycoplasma alkalescens]|uniref:Oligopeptide ABC transporter, permease protein n=4 Tax=Metamycoplasma alkalescens TaxID=45363 RepID=N9UBJ6_9BACT|nr:ABC transporter permease [Metamycoplasma alkalescens]ENY54096.1 Oligopeptide ABC transporter, permease protein [Metamycoplasma alkalescens 14918]PYF43582.1 oligopeptide transport system permease protein [Metamycoplasma alkalescens]
MENNLENQVKDFNKQYKISSELSKKFAFVQGSDKVQTSSIAGRPKKMGIEIAKRFFSNPIVVISLIIFTFILMASLIVPSKLATEYTPNSPINKYSFIELLPPVYSPMVTKAVSNTDPVYKFYLNLKASISQLPQDQQVLWNQWFAFFLDSAKTSSFEGQLFFTYNAYSLFEAGVLNELLFKAQQEGSTLTTDFVNTLKATQVPVLKTYLGTSSTGYDIWVTTWYATWRGIEIAIITTLIQAIFGITIGAFLGFHAGKLVDTIVMRIINIFNSPPTIIWILIFVGIFGTNQVSLILAMSIAGWPLFVGLTRMYIITVKNEEYIVAAKAIGASTPRQIFVHALPAIVGKIANSFVKNVPSAILWVASLAFLGFFKDGKDTNLGQILIESSSEAGQNVWIILLPTLILLFLTLSLNFMAIGIHDALDPRVINKGRRK